MPDQDTVLIPLLAHDGSIRAYALIDAADAALVNSHIWRLAPDGYARRSPVHQDRQITVRMPRDILGLRYGDGTKVDHINRNKLDNRRENLRIATHSENMQNKSSYRGSSSTFRGVHWSEAKGKWMASACVNGKSYHVGVFTNEAEAAEAARTARLRLMPYAVD